MFWAQIRGRGAVACVSYWGGRRGPISAGGSPFASQSERAGQHLSAWYIPWRSREQRLLRGLSSTQPDVITRTNDILWAADTVCDTQPSRCSRALSLKVSFEACLGRYRRMAVNEISAAGKREPDRGSFHDWHNENSHQDNYRFLGKKNPASKFPDSWRWKLKIMIQGEWRHPIFSVPIKCSCTKQRHKNPALRYFWTPAGLVKPRLLNHPPAPISLRHYEKKSIRTLTGVLRFSELGGRRLLQHKTILMLAKDITSKYHFYVPVRISYFQNVIIFLWLMFYLGALS